MFLLHDWAFLIISSLILILAFWTSGVLAPPQFVKDQRSFLVMNRV